MYIVQGANFYIHCKDKKKFKDTLTRFGFYTMTMCKQQNIIINTITHTSATGLLTKNKLLQTKDLPSTE